MKKIVTFCFFLVLSSYVLAEDFFSGDWEVVEAGGDSSFSIALSVDGGKLVGTYCAIATGGNKIDCENDGEKNIDGKTSKNGKAAEVGFYSFFGAVNGKALITKIDDETIQWEILSPPIGGEFYAPKDAVLAKKNAAIVSGVELSKDNKNDGKVVESNDLVLFQAMINACKIKCDVKKLTAIDTKSILSIPMKQIAIINDVAFYMEKNGIYAGAIDLLNKVILADPERTPAYLNLGDALFNKNEILEANKNYAIYAKKMKKSGKENKIPKRVFSRMLAISQEQEGAAE